MIYDVYPKHVGRRAAIAEIQRAIEREGNSEEAAEMIFQATKRYAASPQGRRPDTEYIPHPRTWFHQGRYKDDPKEWELQRAERQVSKTQQRVINNRAAILEGLGYSELSGQNGAHEQSGTDVGGSKTLEGSLGKAANSSD